MGLSMDLSVLVKWKKRNYDHCPLCLSTGAFDHFLYDCPALAEERVQVIHSLYRLQEKYPTLMPERLTYAEPFFHDMLTMGLYHGAYEAIALLEQTERFIQSLQ